METTKTNNSIKNDKNHSKRIRDFFTNIVVWGGYGTKLNLAKALNLNSSIFHQYEKRDSNISVATAKKIFELHPNLPQSLRTELLSLTGIEEEYFFSSQNPSIGYTAKPVQYQINEKAVEYAEETVDIEYITSKVNAGNGYIEMNHPVVMKVNKNYIKKNLPEDVFAVTSHGDSMLKRGITDDTLLIVKRCSDVQDCIGQIVVCICDAEFIVKKLVKNEKGDLELHSESYRDIEPIQLKHRAFRIFGYVITSINDY